ncbi:sulfatase-like hydrolase/transferase [Pontiella agarivorans]|uniref:Sulfatase-like hydrolase/transferase n=1 Tax=Pontiella agarivorans TaxID=3038953 RepID=A0ABU5MY44_9BACT|nr:sulfatase-like hydrolase/transferase [Pontiella agarivorans]MDZ8119112.1 sulfatase-like hydrolase/transferase [Pontiella agarivorans]
MTRCRQRYLFLAISIAMAWGVRAEEKDRPNILWLTCEDNNVDWVGCYGNPHAETPNIDALAAEGFQYMHCYANAPVCAPSRSTWITGIHAVSSGTHAMRSRNKIPFDLVQYYPDNLKENGYYVGNDSKTDYNIGGRNDKACWDNPGRVNWDQLKANQPFFQVINNLNSHESRAQGDVEHTDHDPADVSLRKYHPDLPDIRKTYAKYHDAMKKMDSGIGAALAQLEKSGLAENTIVVYNSDHGGVMPRSKRYIFNSGLHCPLIIRIPERYRHLWPEEEPGMKVDRLVGLIDMPKTWLSLTGTKVPEVMQGHIFLGAQAEEEPAYHFAYRGRMDERCESARAVCDKQYLYIRNYMPQIPWMQNLEFLWRMKAMKAWDEYVKSGRATEVQSRFFRPKGFREELYDNVNDPDNVNNLIENEAYSAVASRMRAELRKWQLQVHDAGLLPEFDMIKRAADNHTTIYEMVRDPELYDLPALLDAADVALMQEPSNRPILTDMLSNPDSGIRYWGVVGLFLLNENPAAVDALLTDESHEVRAMAAWLTIRCGDRDKGLDTLKQMLEQRSYATLKILNILDWIGDDAKSLLPTVKQVDHNRYENDMRDNLLYKYGLIESKLVRLQKARDKMKKKGSGQAEK